MATCIFLADIGSWNRIFCLQGTLETNDSLMISMIIVLIKSYLP